MPLLGCCHLLDSDAFCGFFRHLFIHARVVLLYSAPFHRIERIFVVRKHPNNFVIKTNKPRDSLSKTIPLRKLRHALSVHTSWLTVYRMAWTNIYNHNINPAMTPATKGWQKKPVLKPRERTNEHILSSWDKPQKQNHKQSNKQAYRMIKKSCTWTQSNLYLMSRKDIGIILTTVCTLLLS